MMNKKFTVLLSLLLAATLTISTFAGTTALAAQANKKLDTVGQYTVVVDDKDTGVEIPVMVPLRKMAKATGMKVTKKGNQVRLDTGEMHADFTIGKDAYSLTTSMKGAEGATRQFSLGSAPYAVKKTIYVPMSLFWVIEGNDASVLSIDGQKINFSTKGSDQTQIPNPFVEYGTLADAEKAAGFTFKVPEQINGCKQSYISVMDGKMQQVVYEKGESQVTLRKMAGTDDISGVYIDYAKKDQVAIGGHQTELRGDGTSVFVAVWNNGGYTYAVYADAGVTAAQMTAIVESIQ